MTDAPKPTRAELRAVPLPLSDDEQALVDHILTTLQEEQGQARRQIEALVYHCGMDLAAATLEDTLQVEAEGGMMVHSGERRRTPGGVFLYLMSQRITPEQLRMTIRLYQEKKKPKAKKPKVPGAAPAPRPPKAHVTPEWTVYYEMLDDLFAGRGVATTVKITLIGRPGTVHFLEDTAVAMMEHTVRASSLPKGVPNPATGPTVYAVYIGMKQWRRVETALRNNPDDALIVEGICTFDENLPGMVIYASNATTKGLEAAKREAKAAVQGGAGASGMTYTPAAAPVASPPARQHRAERQDFEPAAVEAPPPPVLRYPVPPGAPPEVAQKLNELQMAADQFRQKLASLDALPPDQRAGYAMTQRLLKSTEDQIAALERRYNRQQ